MEIKNNIPMIPNDSHDSKSRYKYMLDLKIATKIMFLNVNFFYYIIYNYTLIYMILKNLINR